MRISHRATGLVALLLALGACAVAQATDHWPAIDDAITPATNRMISGQPTPAELVAAERAGVRHVVNARDIGEFEAWDQGALLEELGMHYHRVPIGNPSDLDREAVEAFDRILADIGEEPALLHCASGNRIGALYALRAGWVEGKDPETAIEIGKAHGLTRLEAAVREKLDGG